VKNIAEILKFVKQETKEQKMGINNCIAIYRVGSHLYGTNTPTSDEDFEGIFIEDIDYVIGNKRCDEVNLGTNESNTRNTKDDVDFKLYSLRKFIELANENKPEIETFFLPESAIIYKNEYFDRLIKAKDLFLSKRLKHTFYKYAFAQKKKLIGKKKRLEELRGFYEILEKGIKEGKRIIGELNLLETVCESYSERPRLSYVTKMKKEYTYIKYHQNGIGKDNIMVDDKKYDMGADIQRIFKNVKSQIDAYSGRTKDLEEHGFDSKFATTAIRINEEGIELLKTGKTSFPCKNAQFQLEIKQGLHSLEDIIEKIEELELELEEAYNISTLRNSPDMEQISKLQIEMMLDFWRIK